MRLLWELFVVFSRVALFSWGGGPASLALMQREVVAAGWTNPAEFADAVAVGNALPGPIAPQVSAFVGYKVAGFVGAVVAAAGTVVPATLLMLAMIVFFFGVKDSPHVVAPADRPTQSAKLPREDGDPHRPARPRSGFHVPGPAMAAPAPRAATNQE